VLKQDINNIDIVEFNNRNREVISDEDNSNSQTMIVRRRLRD